MTGAVQGNELAIAGARAVRGEVRVPGDKSVSHRVLLLSLLADGTCEIDGLLEGEDCLHTRDAIAAFGARVERTGAGSYRVRGRGWDLAAPAAPVDLGNSGTGMRLLAGIAAGRPSTVSLCGDPSLSRRPMGRITRPLREMGARIDAGGEGERPPLEIRGVDPLRPIHHRPSVSSAQVKSCLMLAALFADGVTEVEEPAASRDHTERLFAHLGLPITIDSRQIRVDGAARPATGIPAARLRVPGDPSSAAFFAVAAAILPGSDLVLPGVMLNPTRVRFLDVLERMGADVEIVDPDESGPETVGSVRVRGGALHGVVIEGGEIPLVIDEIPALAVAAALADGPTVVRDARELRVKESDRVSGVVGMLRAFGIPVDERADGFEVAGNARPRSGRFDAASDHRLAMSAAVLALSAPAGEESRITGARWIDTSFPGFAERVGEVVTR